MNEKVKNWFGKHKWHIVCGIVSAVLIVGCALNIYYACKSEVDANIFTAIGGWVGFLATLGVGIVAFCQNIAYEHRTYKQYEIEKLTELKNTINNDCYIFSNNNAIYKSLYYLAFNSNKQQKNSNSNLKYDFLLIDFISMCEIYVNNINRITYNFDKLLQIHELYCKMLGLLKRAIEQEEDKIYYDALYKSYDYYVEIKNLYQEVLVDFENAILTLKREIKYSKFKKEINKLKEIEKKNDVIEKNIKKYNKETQNGQAEDDVDGQGE